MRGPFPGGSGAPAIGASPRRRHAIQPRGRAGKGSRGRGGLRSGPGRGHGVRAPRWPARGRPAAGRRRRPGSRRPPRPRSAGRRRGGRRRGSRSGTGPGRRARPRSRTARRPGRAASARTPAESRGDPSAGAAVGARRLDARVVRQPAATSRSAGRRGLDGRAAPPAAGCPGGGRGRARAGSGADIGAVGDGPARAGRRRRGPSARVARASGSGPSGGQRRAGGDRPGRQGAAGRRPRREGRVAWSWAQRQARAVDGRPPRERRGHQHDGEQTPCATRRPPCPACPAGTTRPGRAGKTSSRVQGIAASGEYPSGSPIPDRGEYPTPPDSARPVTSWHAG